MPDFSSVPQTRRLTLCRLLCTVLDKGPVSRAELARLTGLSKQTVSELFRELGKDGWISVAGRTSGAVGRRAVVYQVQPRRALVFGADVGGTKIRSALADMAGTIIAERFEATDPRGGDRVVAQVAAVSRALAAEADVPHGRIVCGTIGIPGAFDPRTEVLAMVPNIAGLEGIALRARLEEATGFDIAVDNDVNMAARGEQWRGAGHEVGSFVFIALGTGIGMGIINDGRIVHGARGAAGEIAMLPLGSDPFHGRTFRSGALETAIGSAGIREAFEGRTGRGGISVREIMDAAAVGDPDALATIDEVARTLATAIAAVSAVMDPERVILGGSVGARPELLAGVLAHLPRCMPMPPHCTISTLGDRAGVLGTIAHSLERMREALFAHSGEPSPDERIRATPGP